MSSSAYRIGSIYSQFVSEKNTLHIAAKSKMESALKRTQSWLQLLCCLQRRKNVIKYKSKVASWTIWMLLSFLQHPKSRKTSNPKEKYNSTTATKASMPAWNNGLSAILLKLNPAQIPPKKKINKQKTFVSLASICAIYYWARRTVAGASKSGSWSLECLQQLAFTYIYWCVVMVQHNNYKAGTREAYDQICFVRTWRITSISALSYIKLYQSPFWKHVLNVRNSQ